MVAIDIGLADFVDDWLTNNFDQIHQPQHQLLRKMIAAAEVDDAGDPEEIDAAI